MATTNPVSYGESLRELRHARGWSQRRLCQELRKEAARRGRNVGVTVEMISKWENDHKRPDSFYRDLLSHIFSALAPTSSDHAGTHSGQLGSFEPWQLAHALEGTPLGTFALDQLERAVGRLARSYPSTAPSTLQPPVVQHLAAVTRLLSTPQRLEVRRRLIVIAGQLAGVAGNLCFDLNDPDRAHSYFGVGDISAKESEDDDLASWLLATHSLVPIYHGKPKEALLLIETAQRPAQRGASPVRRAWLHALEARAHAAMGNVQRCLAALDRSDRELDRGQAANINPVLDFFDEPRLLAIKGTCHLLLRQAGQAQVMLRRMLTLRSPADVKGRALAQLDLAQAHLYAGDIDESCTVAVEALSIPPEALVAPILRRAQELRVEMESTADSVVIRAFNEQVRYLSESRGTTPASDASRD